MPEFIAMLGSAPGPKSLGQVPQQRIPNFSVSSIANRGNLQGIPDFSVNAIARRGNLRGLGVTLPNFSTGVASGINANLFTGATASTSPAVEKGALGGCSATIPFSAFVQMANSKVKAWASFRQYADRAFIPATLGRDGIDFYRGQSDLNTQAFKALTEPWADWPKFDEPTYRGKADGRVGRAARYVQKVRGDSAYLTGPYKMEDEAIAYGAPYTADDLVSFYSAKKSQYDADPDLFKADVINEFLLVRSPDPTGPEFAESTMLNVAAAYVAASIPGTFKALTNTPDIVTVYANAKNQSGQKDPGRNDGGVYLNTLIDAAYGFANETAKADPVSGDNKVRGYPDLVGKILAAAMVIAKNIENWSGVSGLPPVRVTLSAPVVRALDMTAPDAIRIICSFDRNLLVDPTARTPSYILTTDAAAQKAQAIKDAIAAAQLASVPAERRLYSFSQLQAAADAAKQAAFSNCTLNSMDQATISQRVEDAITSRRLQTPDQVTAAVEAAKDAVQKLVDAAEKKYDDYVSQDARDDAAVLARAAADLKTATDKAAADLMASEKSGTNKMLIAAGAVAAVAVLAMLVMRKKG